MSVICPPRLPWLLQVHEFSSLDSACNADLAPFGIVYPKLYWVRTF